MSVFTLSESVNEMATQSGPPFEDGKKYILSLGSLGRLHSLPSMHGCDSAKNLGWKWAMLICAQRASPVKISMGVGDEMANW